MEICLVGSANTERLVEFERFARSENRGVCLAVIDGGQLPNVGEKTAGVVIFDDGKSSLAECVAKIREHTRYLGVPLIAVAARTEKDAHARLLAAGVSAVCDYDCENEQILKKIQEHCNAEPVLDEIRKRLLGPFTSATTITMREMAGLEVGVRSVYQKTRYKMFGDISAVIGLMARTEGVMVISFPDHTALAITARILAGVTDDLSSDVVRDCIGEIANVIAGQARGILSNTPYQFAMSTPTIVSGAGHEIRHKPGMPCLVTAYTTELGDFALQLCLGS